MKGQLDVSTFEKLARKKRPDDNKGFKDKVAAYLQRLDGQNPEELDQLFLSDKTHALENFFGIQRGRSKPTPERGNLSVLRTLYKKHEARQEALVKNEDEIDPLEKSVVEYNQSKLLQKEQIARPFPYNPDSIAVDIVEGTPVKDIPAESNPAEAMHPVYRIVITPSAPPASIAEPRIYPDLHSPLVLPAQNKQDDQKLKVAESQEKPRVSFLDPSLSEESDEEHSPILQSSSAVVMSSLALSPCALAGSSSMPLQRQASLPISSPPEEKAVTRSKSKPMAIPQRSKISSSLDSDASTSYLKPPTFHSYQFHKKAKQQSDHDNISSRQLIQSL
jgi:hypothetical protein